MTSNKKKRQKQSSTPTPQQSYTPNPPENPFDSVLVKLLFANTVAYILLGAVVSFLLGKGFITLIVAPLWGLSMFVIAKWDKTRTPGAPLNWKQLFIIPQFNYWNLLGVVFSIFISAQIFTVLIIIYLEKYRLDFSLSAPNDLKGYISALVGDTQAIVLFLIRTYAKR